MFACIYFVEDASLTVVGRNDKKLTIDTEFAERESVSMKWGKQTYHGFIIKINDNEEELTRFANQAYSKLLKNLKEKPKDVPEELFNFKLDTEKTKGKRNRVQTDKIKESKDQDEELSPKKKKKNNEDIREKKQELSPKKKKTFSHKTPAKERTEKKRIEEAAAQKSAVYLSDVLTQFIESDTDENEKHSSKTIRPKSSTDFVVSATARNQELLDLQNQTSRQCLQCTSQPHLPAVQPLLPITELIPSQQQTPSTQQLITTTKQISSPQPPMPSQQLMPSTQPQMPPPEQQVQSSTQPLLHPTTPPLPLASTQSFLSSTQSSMPPQPMPPTTIPSTSMLETWSLCRQSMGTSIEDNSKRIPVPSAEVLCVLRGLQRADVQQFITIVVDHFDSSSCYHVGNDCFEMPDNNTWAPDNSEPYRGVEESEEPQTLSLPQISPLRRSPRKHQRATFPLSEDLQTHEISPLRRSPRKHQRATFPLSEDLQTHEIPFSQESPFRRSPRKHAATTINPNVISSPGVSAETINKQATTNLPSSKKSRETDQDISSPERAEGNGGMVMLLKTYPGVLIKSEALQHAVRSASKSSKPGYTLCYNLLTGVFSIHEIASSRGQGLTKRKDGDLRKALDEDKVAAIKAIVYELLYRNVFHLHTELEEAVQIIREQNKNKNRNGVFPIVDAESSPDSSNSGEDTFSRHEKFVGRRVTPPVPYRIAKALDPVIYRNTELDIWEEDQREAIHRERYKSVTFAAGDKCQVLSSVGPLYHGHIQQIGPEESDPAVVYIEELGQKQEVSRDRLRPAKVSGRSEWFLKQLRRKRLQEMTVTQERIPPMMPQSLPPPPIQIVPPTSLSQEVMSGGIIIPKWQIVGSSPGHVGPGKIESPCSFPQSPQPEMTVIPMSQVQVPRIWVPFMDSIALSNVDVNIMPSQEPMGQDLPLNDLNTLRFFFNVGVAHYGIVSQQALANGAASHGNIQPIVYCHAKPTTSLEPVHGVAHIGNSASSLQSPPPTSKSDDESSNLSNDSGCDADEMAPGQLHLVRDGNLKSVAGAKDNSLESELMDSSVAPRQTCDTESHCSDMSLTDTCESSITVETQEQGGARQYKPRRKYYMYGNLKLVKPIKDVPKRFMDLLKSMNAEKSRVEGEPIILAVPHHHFKVAKGSNSQFNPNAPTFVPGSHGDRVSVNNSQTNVSLSPSSSNLLYPQHLVSSANSNASSYHLTSSSIISTHPQYHPNPLCTGFPPPPPVANPTPPSFLAINSMPH